MGANKERNGNNAEELEKLQGGTSAASSGGLTGLLVLSVSAAVFGSFQFGFQTSVINAPQAVIESFYNATNVERTGSPMARNTLTILWSVTVSIFAIGGMFGGVMGGWWSDYFGRKKGMLLTNIVIVIAALLMGFSKLAKSYEMLIIGRVIVGFGCGLFSGLTPTYLVEVAPNNLRGAIGTVHQLGVTIGILLSQVFGIEEILGTENGWQFLVAIPIVPAILQLIMLPFCPESPRYLLISKDDETAATEALVRLRNTHDVKSDIEEMKNEQLAEASEAKMGFVAFIKSPTLRLPLIICIVMHLSQQLSGINNVFYYSTGLFESMGIALRTAKYISLCVGGIMVTMTIVSIPLMDKAGRRTLHLTGLAGMLTFSILFTVFFSTKQYVDWFKYISITCALIFVVFFAVGPGSIPWMLAQELFSQGPRPVAVSIGVVINWLANFVVGLSFPPLQAGLKTFSFVPFSVITLLCFIFLFIYLPETKNKTIEEISAGFKKRKGYTDSIDNIITEGNGTHSSTTLDTKPTTSRDVKKEDYTQL
ncbi:unnamed protein product [Owenia fusiformis]|uniref:Major facilitator superfamily (MFS) profile domain-containing protein n=1 Tax=Owenia fusiformis TaxID=6347 RepID=A0A8S4P635_OWEFU|nr:unnamed protein product [Owenia fusiformis]